MPENNEVNENDEEPESSVVKTLRERGDTAEAQVAQLQRELAFTQSGIDVSTPMGKFFASKYDGEATVEAVKAAAAEVGLIEITNDSGTAPTEEQIQAQQDREALTGGTHGDTTEPDPDPIEEGLAEFTKARQRGVPIDPAASQFLDRVIDAAAKGDKRAIYDADEWRRQKFADMGIET